MSKYRWVGLLMAAALLQTPGFSEEPAPPKPPEPPKTEVPKETPAPKDPPKGETVKTPVTVEAAKKPQSLEEAASKIPAVELEDGIIIQCGDLKIPLTAVEPRERAEFVAHTKRDPKWKPDPVEKANIRKQAAVKVMTNKIIEAYAANGKLMVPEKRYSDTYKRFTEAKKQRGGSYEQFLVDNGMTDDDFQSFLRASVAIEAKMSESISDEELKKEYDARKDELSARRASDIMFTYKGAEGAPAQVKRTKDEAKKLAEELLKKLRDKPESDFERLAHDMSDSPTSDRGGDMGYVPRKGGMVDVLADAIYKLQKKDEYAEVVESPFGFHVIRLTDIHPEEMMRSQVKDEMVSKRFGAEMQRLVEEAVAKSQFNSKLL